MQLEEIRGLAAMNTIKEGLLKPSEEANGWMVAVENRDGEQFALTDDHDHTRIYHSLDKATLVLKELGISPIKVVEAF
ncbi:MAG: hypothetical protein V7731_00085 [Amphritea sp.]